MPTRATVSSWVTEEAPYVIKLVTTIPTGKWVTVTISMI